MIDSKKLMIGDYVRLTADGDNEILQVTSVHKKGVGFEKYAVYFDEIEPIQLTAEIFELNGFDVTSTVARLREYYIVEYCFYDYSVSMKNGFNTLFKKCTYVHELQHALRLCGLHELADNFKVK